VSRRAPRPLTAALDSLTAGLAPPGLIAEVQRVWRDAVGAEVARVASPVSERDGTVTVVCESATWAQELELLGPTLAEALNARLRTARVRGLRCRVQR